MEETIKIKKMEEEYEIIGTHTLWARYKNQTLLGSDTRSVVGDPSKKQMENRKKELISDKIRVFDNVIIARSGDQKFNELATVNVGVELRKRNHSERTFNDTVTRLVRCMKDTLADTKLTESTEKNRINSKLIVAGFEANGDPVAVEIYTNNGQVRSQFATNKTLYLIGGSAPIATKDEIGTLLTKELKKEDQSTHMLIELVNTCTEMAADGAMGEKREQDDCIIGGTSIVAVVFEYGEPELPDLLHYREDVLVVSTGPKPENTVQKLVRFYDMGKIEE